MFLNLGSDVPFNFLKLVFNRYPSSDATDYFNNFRILYFISFFSLFSSAAFLPSYFRPILF